MVPKEFGKQRILNDESSGCRTSLVAENHSPFLATSPKQNTAGFDVHAVLDVVMWWIFECQKNYTKNWESFWYGYPGTWRTKIIFPVSWFCNSADLRGLLDNQHHRSIARRTPSKKLQGLAKFKGLNGTATSNPKVLSLSRDVDLSQFSLGWHHIFQDTRVSNICQVMSYTLYMFRGYFLPNFCLEVSAIFDFT